MNKEVVNYLLSRLNQGRTRLCISELETELKTDLPELTQTMRQFLQDGILCYTAQGNFVFSADIETFRDYLLSAEEGAKTLTPYEEDDREPISYEEVMHSDWVYDPTEESGAHQMKLTETLILDRRDALFDDDDDDDDDDFDPEFLKYEAKMEKRRNGLLKRIAGKQAEQDEKEVGGGKKEHSDSDTFVLFRSQDRVERQIQSLLDAGKAANREEALQIIALKLCIEQDTASASMLQRALSIGFARASKIMEWMESRGYVSGFMGNTRKRKVLMTMEQFDRFYGKL
mgnify:CR=1 FL=1